MALPVLPPTLLSAFRALDTAPETAGPAEVVTRERPCEAFETTPEAESFAFEAVSPAVSFAFAAVSAAVEACRMLGRRRKKRDCRSTAREAGAAAMVSEGAT